MTSGRDTGFAIEVSVRSKLGIWASYSQVDHRALLLLSIENDNYIPLITTEAPSKWGQGS
jgi:hypothetical protein